MLGIVKHLHLGALQSAGEIYVGILAATILFIAANAGIIGASRLVYSMGLHRQVPDRLSRLHPRFSTPWIGILLFGGVACLTIIPGKAEFLGNMYAFGAMLSFTIAHLSVIRLRVKEPDRPRPYRGPGTLRIAGRELPLFALLGIFGTGLAFVAVTVLHLDVAVAGVVLAVARDGRVRRSTAAGTASTCARPSARRAASVRRTSRSSTTSTALVPIFGDDVSAAALISAAKLIGEKGVVYAMFVLPVPSQLSLESGPGGGGSDRALGARERAHPGAARGHQDPHGPDPHAQPRRGARRGGASASKCGRHLLVDDPRAGRRAAASARRPPTCSASVPAA